MKLTKAERITLNQRLLEWTLMTPMPIPIPLTGHIIPFILWIKKRARVKKKYIAEILTGRGQ